MNINKIKTKQDLEEIFRCMNEPLFRYIYVRCGYNRELAEDMTQEIFFKAWKKKELFNPTKSSLQNWLYIITRNYLTDHYRKYKPETKTLIEEIDEVGHLNENCIDNELMVESVLKELEKLNLEEKEVLILRYIQDLEIKDISKIIDKGYIATKVKIHRALKKLKKEIKK